MINLFRESSHELRDICQYNGKGYFIYFQFKIYKKKKLNSFWVGSNSVATNVRVISRLRLGISAEVDLLSRLFILSNSQLEEVNLHGMRAMGTASSAAK